MNSYSYVIIDLVTDNKNDQKPNNVVRVLTQLTAFDDQNKSVSINCFFDILVQSGDFVPFEQLDETTVRFWIDNYCLAQMNVFKAQLDQMLVADQPIVEVVSSSLPWVNQTNTLTDTVSVVNTSTTMPILGPEQIEFFKKLIREVLAETGT